MTDRKKPGVAFWATVALVVVLVGYPLSAGPMNWLVENHLLPRSSIEPLQWFYSPVVSLLEWHDAPAPIRWLLDLYVGYVKLWL